MPANYLMNVGTLRPDYFRITRVNKGAQGCGLQHEATKKLLSLLLRAAAYSRFEIRRDHEA